MGDPRRIEKKWRGPRHPWRTETLNSEMRLIGTYGLRNKSELWKARTLLRRYRRRAREILALPEEETAERGREILSKLFRQGLLGEDATLDDVLGLRVEDILDRRLQTVVFRKGIGKSAYQARQYVVHGHIAVSGSRVRSPGCLVSREDEEQISFFLTIPASGVSSQE